MLHLRVTVSLYVFSLIILKGTSVIVVQNVPGGVQALQLPVTSTSTPPETTISTTKTAQPTTEPAKSTTQPTQSTIDSATSKTETSKSTTKPTKANKHAATQHTEANIQVTHLNKLKELYNILLSDYDIRLRPTLNQSRAIIVRSNFIPNNIVKFDTTNQQIDILGFFVVQWTDEQLIWNKEDFMNTNYIKLPTKQIWRPPLTVENAYTGSGFIGHVDTDVVMVDSSGHVEWVPEGIYSVLCKVTVEFYPFDVQKCELTYYASDELISAVELNGPTKVTTDDFIENSEWRLVEVHSRKTFKYTTNMIHLTFVLERRAQFTMYTLVAPLMLLSILNVFLFLMPVDSEEKVTVAITIFLAYSVLATSIRDMLPHNSLHVSHFVNYIFILLLLSTISVVYVIIEKRIASYYGKTVCKLGFGTSNKVKPSTNDVDPVTIAVDDIKPPIIHVKPIIQNIEDEKACITEEKGQEENNVEQADCNGTWSIVINKIGICLFVLTFLTIMVVTIVTFTILLGHSNKWN